MKAANGSNAIELPIAQISIQSCDTDQLAIEEQNSADVRLQALISTDAHSHMKLYFNHFIVLSNTLQKVISAQGFESRLEQYEAIRSLPESLLGESMLVR